MPLFGLFYTRGISPEAERTANPVQTTAVFGMVPTMDQRDDKVDQVHLHLAQELERAVAAERKARGDIGNFWKPG
jgi:hypothetical protein